MTRILVIHGPGADPSRRGLVSEPPGSPAALDERCRMWGRALAAEVATAWAVDARGMVGELQRNSPSADALVLVAGDAAFDSVALGNAVAATSLPAVDLHLADLRRAGRAPGDSRLATAGARLLHGRGTDGYRWAVHHLARRAAHPPAVLPYGSGPNRVGDLRLPQSGGLRPVAVLVHGGFWYDAWERDLMDGLAVALVRDGWATWNVEYRRLGSGGGWPASAEDVAAAVDHLAELAAEWDLDLDDVCVVGHSAGAQLGLLAAARRDTAVRPRLAVALAGVLDLAAAHEQRLGDGAVAALLGDPPAASELAEASPLARLPLGVPALVAHLTHDPLVPAEQSRAYAAAARAVGDDVALLELPGDDHFALLDPAAPAWRAVVGALQQR